MTLYMRDEENRRNAYDQGREEERTAYAKERAAYAERESFMLAEIAALKQQLSALSPKH